MTTTSEAVDPRLPAPPTAGPSSSTVRIGTAKAPAPPPSAEAAPGSPIATSLAGSARASPPLPSAEAGALAEDALMLAMRLDSWAT
eukprot:4537188-Alexandrium_andersonii.AAC.1